LSAFKILLCFIILAGLGYIFIPSLSIDLLPNKALPVLTISFTLDDATPEVTEQEATAPLENALSQLTQLKKIYSVSGYGLGTIELTFDTVFSSYRYVIPLSLFAFRCEHYKFTRTDHESLLRNNNVVIVWQAHGCLNMHSRENI
jgi:hypothetical protein